ncbi:ubiquitin carboxyl-terminal hydrolase 8-like [Oppia nitens]|uniref:ubiquitin carboxyl-terminal hydrolase 8-like n=1 Tax=Oppia nitens TaxID=1686743 RepID=UPI0023DAB8F3|nr:ubiquitin carboxyl-terminal hydrolase 8-like [Oppia nitens]
MPTKTFLKDLYIAKSLELLTKKAEESNKNNANTNSLLNSANKLYSEAKRSHIDGDEERAYILYYRYFQTIKTIKQSNDYKKDEKYYSGLIGLNKLKEVVETLETLVESLVKRYNTLKESLEMRAKEINESNAVVNDNLSNKSSDSSKSKSSDTNDSDYPVIDSVSLVEHLENSSDINKILIIDIRSADEFNKSSISIKKVKTSADVNVINIPNNLLVAGMTAAKLDQHLPFGSDKDVFSRRRSMTKIIIVDNHSQELIAKTPIYYLIEAIYRWDASSLKIKNKPFILKGGFIDWTLTYPMHTTNPQYKPITRSIPINRYQMNLTFNYELSELETEIKKPENTNLVNTVTDNNADNKSDISANCINNIFNSKPTNMAVPGTAKPVIPDRSTKPKLQTETIADVMNTTGNAIKDDFEKIKLRKQNEISEEMISTIRQQYEETIESFQKDIESKDKENTHLRQTVIKLMPQKPSHLVNNSKNKESPVVNINGNINTSNKRNGFYLKVDESGDENKENTETHDMDSSTIDDDMNGKPIPTINRSMNRSSNSLSVSSSLSRSLSSPNMLELIAKETNGNLTDDMGIESKEVSSPHFDRSLKPMFSIEKYNFQELDNKQRDFSAVRRLAGPSITGLRNLGNTCFSNAVIQCLLNTTEFSSFFNGKFNINKNSKFGSNGELVIELAALFRQMAFPSPYKSLAAKDFKNAVCKHFQGFIPGQQQDAHEFLVKLLEKLHEDLNESTIRDIDTNISEDLSLQVAANKFWKNHLRKNKSIITDLFEGFIVNSLMCLTCHKTSNTFEVFSCLSLPLGNHKTTLNDCIRQYFKPERMSGEAAWECPTCKQKREADKKILLWKLPKVLIIHLKRFSYEGRWKLSTYVEFPIDELQIQTSQSSVQSRYNLYGVVNHSGTLECGHYTAYSQNLSKYKWHKFDDQEITQINVTEIKSQSAYILFYRCV